MRGLIRKPEEERSAGLRAFRKERLGVPGEDVGRVVAALVAEVPRPAVVAHVVVVVARGSPRRQTSWRSRARAGDPVLGPYPFRNLPTNPVRYPACCNHTGRVSPGSRSVGYPGSLEKTPWLCGYWPVRIPARSGQHSGGAARPSRKRVPRSTMSANVRGMYRRLKLFCAWSSTSTTRKFGAGRGSGRRRRLVPGRQVGREPRRESGRAEQQHDNPGPRACAPAHASKLAHGPKAVSRPC